MASMAQVNFKFGAFRSVGDGQSPAPKGRAGTGGEGIERLGRIRSLLILNKCVATRLPTLWSSLVEQKIELFEFSKSLEGLEKRILVHTRCQVADIQSRGRSRCVTSKWGA